MGCDDSIRHCFGGTENQNQRKKASIPLKCKQQQWTEHTGIQSALSVEEAAAAAAAVSRACG